MTRLIIILTLIFIILTLIKGFLKKNIIKHSQKDINNSGFNSNISHEKKSGTGIKDDKIVDAKFEELK